MPTLPAPNLPSKSIMVIDDNFDMLHLGRVVLEMEGFRVITASSGTQALDILSKIQEPNLVLLDMKMSDMSGHEFLKRLEIQAPTILDGMPVVFYSGMESVPDSRASGFIRKAGDIKSFIASVHGFIGRASPIEALSNLALE
ncbi:MAG: response regulator [Bdellovibrionota bacterium]